MFAEKTVCKVLTGRGGAAGEGNTGRRQRRPGISGAVIMETNKGGKGPCGVYGKAETVLFDGLYFKLRRKIRDRQQTDDAFKAALASAVLQRFPVDYVPGWGRFDPLLCEAVCLSKTGGPAGVLLDAGADPNFCGVCGIPPLQLAVGWFSPPALAEKLLAAGAEVDAVCLTGVPKTALSRVCENFIAVRPRSRNHLNCLQYIKLLLDAGAEPVVDTWRFSRKRKCKKRVYRRKIQWLDTYFAAWDERRAATEREGAAPAFDYAL